MTVYFIVIAGLDPAICILCGKGDARITPLSRGPGMTVYFIVHRRA
jgi:hypothetical protein